MLPDLSLGFICVSQSMLRTFGVWKFASAVIVPCLVTKNSEDECREFIYALLYNILRFVSHYCVIFKPNQKCVITNNSFCKAQIHFLFIIQVVSAP